MKKVLNILLVLATLNSVAQIRTGSEMPDSLRRTDSKYTPFQTLAGTCASPDGNMNVTPSPPPSYAWEQANGYCNPGSYGKNGTVCWNFTPSQPSVNINSGFATLGCTTIGFGPFTLYKCAPSCSVMGSGLSFTVTVGQCYTWCMTWSATGPPSCDVTDLCPYYQQFTNPLPIELSYFAGSNQGNANVLQWKTETEINDDFFVVEISTDALNWNELSHIDGAGNSNHALTYSYKDKNFSKAINYYRLKQVDNDGTFKYNGIIAIDNSRSKDIKVIRILNMLGQDVDENYEGIKILYYSDGDVVKQF